MKNRRIGRRTLCLLLAVVMMLSLGMQGAFAADDTVYATDLYGRVEYKSVSAAWSAAKNGAFIRMMRDWTLSERLALDEGESATIDLNGYMINRNLSGGATDGEVFYLDEGASLTLKSSAEARKFEFQGWTPGQYSYRRGCRLTTGGLITGGWSTNGAGGVHMKKGAVLTLDNVAVAGNYSQISWFSDGYGGGVMMDGDNCSLIMKNGAYINNNWAEDEGGGVYCNGTGAVIEMTGGSTIGSNTSWRGGGIYFCYSEFTLRSEDRTGVIINNRSNFDEDGNGGGIYVEQCQTSTNAGVIYGMNVNYNVATGSGGGIFLDQENTTVSHCNIVGNRAGVYGGGIFVYNDDNTLSNCTIQSNHSKSYGGGVAVNETCNIGLSGTLVIKDNESSKEQGLGGADDLFLIEYKFSTAYIEGVPTANSQIGIYTVDKDGQRLNADDAFYYEQAFFFDDKNYHVEYDAEENELRVAEGAGKTVPTPAAVAPETNVAGEYNDQPLITGYFRYASHEDSTKDSTSVYYYSDGYFLDGDEFDGDSPENYNTHLATVSMAMAMAGFNSNIGLNNEIKDQTKYDLSYTLKSQNIEMLMTDIGVASDDIFVSESYCVKPGVNTIGVAIGQKVIGSGTGNDYVLVPIVVRGAGYECEDAGNLNLGTSGEASGFADAANQVFKQVQEYLKDYNLESSAAEGKLKFWITGYSRGGAVANLTAKRLVEAYCSYTSRATCNQVYAYCFEAPQGGVNSAMTLSADDYYCIHNCINKADLIAEAVPDEMGFIRYGVDHYVPGNPQTQTPGVSTGAWKFVSNQSWAANYKTWYDNASWTVGSTDYQTQRTKMLEQLGSVDPVNISFHDRFAIAEQDIFPALSTDELSVDGTAITQEEYIHILTRALQSWGFYGTNEGDLRASYTSSFKNGNGVSVSSVESALQVLVPIYYSKSEAEREEITSAIMAGRDALLGGVGGIYRGIEIWDNVIGDWITLSQNDRDLYLQAYWEYLMCTKAPITNKCALDYFTDEEAKSLRAAWETLADVLLRFIAVDYNYDVNDWNDSQTPTDPAKTTPITDGITGNQASYGNHSLVVLGTLIRNAMALRQANYPEINFSWLRSYDSFYDTDANKNTPVSIKTDATPTVEAACSTDGILTLESSIKGAAVFYRISSDDGESFDAWKPYNLPVSLPTGDITVQTVAVYCGNVSAVASESYYVNLTEPYPVKVNGKEVGSYLAGSEVTIDGTSADTETIFKYWRNLCEDLDLTDDQLRNAVLTFEMPAEEVSLLTYCVKRINSVTLTVDAPTAGEDLPETGRLAWLDDYGHNEEETVSVYWLEQVDGKTQTASGTAKYGTLYSVAAVVPQNLDKDMAFSFGLSKKNATVVYGSTTQKAEKAYTDDAGALRIFGGQIQTQKLEITNIPSVAISVADGAAEADLVDALPTSVTVALSDGTYTTLALDTAGADLSAVLVDGVVARKGSVTVPVIGTDSVDAADKTVSVSVSIQGGAAIEAPIPSVQEEDDDDASLFAVLNAVSPLVTDSVHHTLGLVVTLTSDTPDAKIWYRINGGTAKVYTDPFTLNGTDGEKRTFVITAWAETDSGRSSDASYTYILDNPYTVTIHGKDTGFKGVIGSGELWDVPKTYTYYKGATVTIAAPAEADELFEKWDAVPDGVTGKVTDTALTVKSITGDIELTAIYNPVIKKLELEMDAPVLGKALDEKLNLANVTVTNTYEMTDYFKTIEWLPADTVAARGTVYTAKLALDPVKIAAEAEKQGYTQSKAEALKYFLSENLELVVNKNDNGIKASVAKTNDAIYITFPATASQSSGSGALASVDSLIPTVVSYADAQNGSWNLPKTATLCLTNGGTVSAPVTWTEPTFDSDKQSYTVTGTVTLPDTVTNPDGVSTTVTICVLVTPAENTAAVAAPQATLPSGAYKGKQYVRLTCRTDGTELYYTLDGTEPTAANGTLYTENATIPIPSSATLKAVAIKDGVSSTVTSYTYTIRMHESSSSTDNGTNNQNNQNNQSSGTQTGTASCAKDSTCPVSAFADANAAAWYHDGVHYCLENGLMKGYSDDKFGPNDNLSRAQVVTMLWRVAGSPASSGSTKFSDVSDSAYYAAAVSWAAENGVVLGLGDGTFGPNNNVTREQLATTLCRYAAFASGKDASGSSTALDSFGDAASVSSWALNAMCWACENGILNGVDGNLVPQGAATRAQCAAIFQRFCEMTH